MDKVCCPQRIFSAKANQDSDETLPPHCQNESSSGVCGSEGWVCGFGAANLELTRAEFGLEGQRRRVVVVVSNGPVMSVEMEAPISK